MIIIEVYYVIRTKNVLLIQYICTTVIDYDFWFTIYSILYCILQQMVNLQQVQFFHQVNEPNIIVKGNLCCIVIYVIYILFLLCKGTYYRNKTDGTRFFDQGET